MSAVDTDPHADTGPAASVAAPERACASWDASKGADRSVRLDVEADGFTPFSNCDGRPDAGFTASCRSRDEAVGDLAALTGAWDRPDEQDDRQARRHREA